MLQNKYNTLKSTIKTKHEEQLKEIHKKLDNLAGHQHIIQSLKEIELKDLETNAKFYQTYQKVSFNNFKNIDA